ncbi:hypothetical protein EV567_4320 [Streptomyces sp. BK239]|nr:hypothetical protein EV567_4320 [Streptomyces sp. BK239]
MVRSRSDTRAKANLITLGSRGHREACVPGMCAMCPGNGMHKPFTSQMNLMR